MKVIEWEQITPELKKVDISRKIGLVASLVLSGLCNFPIAFAMGGGFFHQLWTAVETSFVLGIFVFGVLIIGWLHTYSLRSKDSMKRLLFIPIFGWCMWIIVQFFACYCGYFFVFADIFKWIMKKPIVYQWDISAICNHKENE